MTCSVYDGNDLLLINIINFMFPRLKRNRLLEGKSILLNFSTSNYVKPVSYYINTKYVFLDSTRVH